MTAPDPFRDPVRERLAFLLEIVMLDAEHLQATDGRLFAQTFTVERAVSLRADAQLAERLDAFEARFARLQDFRRQAPACAAHAAGRTLELRARQPRPRAPPGASGPARRNLDRCAGLAHLNGS